MKLEKEMIADMVRVKDLEAMLAMQMHFDQEAAHLLATKLVRNREKVMDILSAEYEIEVNRV